MRKEGCDSFYFSSFHFSGWSSRRHKYFARLILPIVFPFSLWPPSSLFYFLPVLPPVEELMERVGSGVRQNGKKGSG